MATERLRLALREIGANAAQHGDSLEVTYTVEMTGDGEVAVRVQDGGPGLPDMERRVLEAGRETPLEHGSGLGLWLINWIVTGLGGEVTTTVDDGTTVTVRMSPATDGTVPEHRDAVPALGTNNRSHQGPTCFRYGGLEWLVCRQRCAVCPLCIQEPVSLRIVDNRTLRMNERYFGPRYGWLHLITS